MTADATFDADPPEKPKRKPGARRFKKVERVEGVRQVAKLIERLVKPYDVVKWAVLEYGITQRAAWDLVKDAREFLAAFLGRSRKQLRIEVASFYTTVVADPTASYSDRMTAASHLSKLLGLMPPRRVVKADLPADDMTADERREMLSQMRQDMLSDPTQRELLHLAYERQGADPSTPFGQQILLREFQVLQVRCKGIIEALHEKPADPAPAKLPNGLRELPPHMQQANGDGSH